MAYVPIHHQKLQTCNLACVIRNVTIKRVLASLTNQMILVPGWWAQSCRMSCHACEGEKSPCPAVRRISWRSRGHMQASIILGGQADNQSSWVVWNCY